MNLITKLNNPPEIRSQLLCFHWVGGTAVGFKSAALYLEKFNVEVFAVNLDGRNGRNIAAMKATIEEVVAQVFEFLLGGKRNELGSGNIPVAFFGHSYGGIVAYELAFKLEKEKFMKFKVASVIVSAVKDPLILSANNKNSAVVQHHKQNDKDLFDYINSIGGLPKGLDPAFLMHVLPTIRCDYKAFESYHYQENKLTCPIIAFVAKNDVSVSRDAMLGWSRCTSANFQMIDLVGSHFYLTDETTKYHFQQVLQQVLIDLK